MKHVYIFLVALAVLLGPVGSLFAQIQVSCTLSHKKYLRYEPILAKVTVKNSSGQRIVLAEHGSQAALLTMEVTNTRGYPADRQEAVMLEKPVVLEPQEKVELLIYVNSAYKVSKVDAYAVKAKVEFGDMVYSSKKSFFDTYEGSVIARTTTLDPPRVHTIRKISRPNKGTYLYLRVDDPHGKMNYGVSILDTMVPVYTPRMTVDGEGYVHTLHRKSPQQYVEVILDSNGREKARHYYRSSYGEVNLMRDEAGNIRVDGVVKLNP